MKLTPHQIWASSLVRAYLVRRFLDGFCSVRPEGAHMLVLFPAVQIMASIPLMSCIGVGKSGPASLEQYVGRIVKSNCRHLLEDIPDAIMRDKESILSVILASISTHLARIELSTARLTCGKTVPGKAESELPDELKREGRKAELLGTWFGALSPRQTATILGFDIE